MANLPYIVYGTVTDSDDAVVSGVRVTLRNDTNGEKVNTTTNSSGRYAVDAGNLTSGYLETDYLTVACSYGLEYDEESFEITGSNYNQDLELEEEAESGDLTYCQVQDVLDELGGKTTSDISYSRLRKIILRSEAEIDARCGTSFKSNTVTNEYHDFDQYTSYRSPEQLRTYSTDYLVGTRNDFRSTTYNDKFRLDHYPVIAITSLYRNANGNSSSDSWTLLTEQTGSGGDFIVDKDTGFVTFVNNYPALGMRKIKVSYTYGITTVPKTIERLCILLSVRDVLVSKSSESLFDNQSSISIESISISGGISGSVTYYKWLTEEINKLWDIIGDNSFNVA